jgi:hypothetical protein
MFNTFVAQKPSLKYFKTSYSSISKNYYEIPKKSENPSLKISAFFIMLQDCRPKSLNPNISNHV